MNAESRPRPNGHVSWELVEEAAVVVDPSEGNVYHFNAVGTEIWKALDGIRTIEEIVGHVQACFEVKQAKIRKDVLSFIKQLRDMDLVSEQTSHE